MIHNQIYKNKQDLDNIWEYASEKDRLFYKAYGVQLNQLKDQQYKKIGIQTQPGVKIKLIDNNESETDIIIGITGIFELDLTNIDMYYIKEIRLFYNPDEKFNFILIDLLREGGN